MYDHGFSFRSFSVSANHGAAATRTEFPWEWWCQFCTFTSLRRWRPWGEHGGIRPELLSWWQDGWSLQERWLCKSSLSIWLFLLPLFSWVTHSLTLDYYKYRVEEMLTKMGERRMMPKRTCPRLKRIRAQRWRWERTVILLKPMEEVC